MESIREILGNFGDYVNLIKQPREDHAFALWINNNLFSDDLLAKYRLHLFQTKETNMENIRLSNLASTRMSRVQQLLDETCNSVDSFYTQLRALPHLGEQVENLNQQITELERFLYQTEVSMACLEKVHQLIAEGNQARQ